MNKVHRITWSKARSAFVVTHENASCGGQPSTTCSAVGAALLILLLHATPALAANVCGAGSNTISGTQASSDNCTISNNGASVTVDNTGSLATAGSPAITATGAVGSITNAGTVTATSTRIGIFLNGATLSGDLTNRGTLSSVADGGWSDNGAFYASNSTITGSLINDGGKVDNVLYLRDSKVTNVQNINGGAISVSGNQVYGIRLASSTVSNGILNDATSSITTSGYGAIDIYAGSVGAGGIINRGTLANGGVAVSGGAKINGDIVNSGTIKDVSSTGGIYLGTSTLNGNVINSGTISNSRFGIAGGGVTITGSILNEKTIQATSVGILVDQASVVKGGIVNSGSITATDNSGISVGSSSKVTGGIRNTGTISGKWMGIVLNKSELTAGADGVALYNNNSILAGNVARTDESGIAVTNLAKVSGNVVNDGGTIGGSKIGIRVDGASQINGQVNNSGNINGTRYAVYVSDDSTLTGLVAQGSSARYIGDVYASNTDFTVATGATFSNDNAYNVKGFVVANGARFTLKAGASTSGMASDITVGGNGFANAGTVTLDAGTTAAIHGNYTQAGTGTLRIGDNSGIHAKLTVDGTATNAGNIVLATNGGLTAGNLSNSNSGTLALAGGNIVSTTNGFINEGKVALDANVRSTISGSYAQTASGTLSLDTKSLLTVGNATNAGKVNLSSGSTLTATSLSNSGTVTLADGARINTTGGFSNSGILSLGSSVSASVQGDYTQSNTGIFRVGVNDDTTYAKLAVNGTVNLGSNAKIDVDVSNKDQVFNSKRLQNILTATTLNSDGTFAVTDNSLLFNFGAIKDGNAVHLTIASAAATGGPTVLGSVKETNNTPALGAASVLDQVMAANPTGAIGNLFVSLTSKEAVSQAVTQTLPLLTGGSMAAASDSISGINRVVQARIEANRGLSSGDAALSDQHLWFKPFGSWAKQHDRDGVSGFKASTTGFVAGADAAVSERSRLGLGFAYANARVNGNSSIAPQQVDVDVYQLLGYGSYSLNERTELNFQADIGQNSNQGSRSLAFTSSTARASYKSLTTHVGVGLGHILPLSAATAFTPSLRLDYSRIKDKAYAESGAGALNLNVAGRSAEEMLLAVDGKLTHNLDSQTSMTANLGAAYDMLSKKASIVAAFAGAPGAAFTTYGMDAAPWSVRGGLGLVKKLAGGMEIAARYDAEGRKGFINQTASVKLRWAF